jgi:hypothetical protein
MKNYGMVILVNPKTKRYVVLPTQMAQIRFPGDKYIFQVCWRDNNDSVIQGKVSRSLFELVQTEQYLWSPKEKELRYKEGPWIEYTRYTLEQETEEKEKEKRYLLKMALARNEKMRRIKGRAEKIFDAIKDLGLSKDQFWGAINWIKEHPRDFLLVEEKKNDT